MAYLDKTGLTYFWGKIKAFLSAKADLINGKIPDEQLPDTVATKTDLENAITSIDNSLSTAIGSGVLE